MGAFKPGSRRTASAVEWIGSVLLDADLADFVLHESTSERDARILGESVVARPVSQRVTGARSAVKRDLHRRGSSGNTAPIDTLIDALRARVRAVFARLGVPVTHEINSGWGLHLHIHLDEPATAADHEMLCRQLQSVADAARAEVGYELIDGAATQGGTQLAREIGSVNGNAAHCDRVVERVGGDASARWSWRTWTPPARVDDSEEARERRRVAACVVTAITGVTKADRDKALRQRERLLMRRRAVGTSQPRISPSTHSVGRGRKAGTLAELGASLSVGSRTAVKCPKHDDRVASATLWVGQSGDLMLSCHSACRETWLVAEEVQTEDDRPVYAGRDALDAAFAAVKTALEAATAAPTVGYTPPSIEEMADRAARARGLFETMGDRGIDKVVATRPGDAPAANRGRVPHRSLPDGADLSREYADMIPRVVQARRSGRWVAEDALIEAVGDAKIILFRGTTGVGKTQALAAFLRSLGSSPKALAICHRRSLVHSAVARLGLRHAHVDPDGVVRITKGKIESMSLGTCVDSVRHIVDRLPRDARFDAVVIDESESVLPACANSGTLNDREAADTHWSARKLVRRHADRIILADAHLSDASVDALAIMLGVSVPELLSQAVLIEDRRQRHELSPMAAVRLEELTDAVIAAKAMADCGRPFWFMTGSKAEADALARELEAGHPDRRWPVITSDGTHPDGRAFMADANAWVTEHRGHIGGIICTPSVESGLSVDVELATPDETVRALGGIGGDVVIMSGRGHQTWCRLGQMMSRPRFASMVIFAAPDAGQASRWSCAAELLRAAEEGHEDIASVIRLMPASTPWSRDSRFVIADRDHAQALADAEMVESDRRRRVGLDFSRWLVAEGHPVTIASSITEDGEATDQSIIAARDAAEVAIADRKVEIREETFDAILAADPAALTLAEARAILDGSGDPSLRPVAARVVLEDSYGPGMVDRETLAFDDNGRGRRAVSRWADLVAWQRGEVDALIDGDVVSARVMAGKAHHVRRAAVTDATLRAFGITPDVIDGRAEGDKLTFKRKGEIVTMTAVTFDADDGRFDALACWIADRRVRDALLLHCKVDPWAYIPTGDRAWLETDKIQSQIRSYYDRKNANDDNGLHGVLTPCDHIKEEGGSRQGDELPWSAPRGHKLAQLVQVVAERIGIAVTSRQVRVDGKRIRRILVDTDSARQIARLGARHLHRVHGVVTAPVVEALIEEQIEAERVMDREVCYERATATELDELKARHAVALDLANRQAVAERDPRASYRMGQAVATFSLGRGANALTRLLANTWND